MRILKMIVLSTALVLPTVSPFAALAEAPVPTITVTGEATVQATPDMATISLGVTTQGPTGAEAMKANTEALAKVIARLKAAGIEDKGLQTQNLSLNPNWSNYDSGSGQTQTITGYTAANILSVRVRDLATLGGVLDAAIGDGANTLNGLSFDLSQPRPAQDEARKAATEDARARAELLAEAAGVKLGRVLSISEQQSYGGPMPVTYKADMASAVPVQAGQVGMAASVTITYEIAQ